MQNLVVVFHTVWAHVGHKILGTPGPRPSGRGRACPLETCSYPTCVTISNLVALCGIRRGSKIGGRWAPPLCEVGVVDPLETRCCPSTKFGHFRSNGMDVGRNPFLGGRWVPAPLGCGVAAP